MTARAPGRIPMRRPGTPGPRDGGVSSLSFSGPPGCPEDAAMTHGAHPSFNPTNCRPISDRSHNSPTATQETR